MDDHNLRLILLDVTSRLNDNDRKRLHFYLQNDVPRLFTDDLSYSGTLTLIQSLFDQDKINGNNFTFLINAFEQIGCSDAANCLRGHQHRMFASGNDQSKACVALILPPTNDISMTAGENNNPINTNEDRKFLVFSDKREFETYSAKQKRLFSPCVLFGLTLITLLVVVIGGTKYIHSFEVHLQNDQNAIQSNDLLLEKDTLIEKLNKTLIELQKQPKTSLIKAGRKFGGDGGSHFDDSMLSSFTSTDYLSGIIVSQSDKFDSCQFIYSSLHNNKNHIQSPVHGFFSRRMKLTSTYHLEHDEKISEVRVKSSDITFTTTAKGLFTTRIVKGLQFITTKGRRIPSDVIVEDDDDGIVESERFPGYTLGYATGRTGLKIDQLQFFWYRTEK